MAKSKKKPAIPEKSVSRAVDVVKKMGVDCGLQVMDSANIENIPRNSSGIISLDIALGGGYPQGRIIEIFGPESGGKTTVSLHAIAAAQAMGGVCAFIDVEHAYDPTYGAKLGVNSSELIFGQPDSGEKALQQAEYCIDNLKHGDLVVIDSVANLTPQAEIDGDIGDSHVGLLARLMSQALRMLTSKVAASGVTLIFINQIRMKIGVMFGSPETTTGGGALKFYASQRLDVRRLGFLKEKGTNGEYLGNQVRIKVVKNKVAPPFRETELDLYYGHGFLRSADLFHMGLERGVIKKEGSWYKHNGNNIGHGALNAKTLIGNTPELMEQISLEILEHINGKP